ncbi:MAG: hypothetical protein II659_08370 [Bacteroidales bacterium]|nr:hypothetical protein [Bacteroidales bacterium]
MKKIFLFASAVFMATMFAGCAKEVLDNQPAENPSVNEGKAITLTVSAVTKNPQTVASQEFDGSPLTKISYGTADANWEEGDKIFLVRNDGTTITLTLTSGAGTASGSFASTDPVLAGTYIPYAVSAASLSKGYVVDARGNDGRRVLRATFRHCVVHHPRHRTECVGELVTAQFPKSHDQCRVLVHIEDDTCRLLLRGIVAHGRDDGVVGEQNAAHPDATVIDVRVVMARDHAQGCQQNGQQPPARTIVHYRIIEFHNQNGILSPIIMPFLNVSPWKKPTWFF